MCVWKKKKKRKRKKQMLSSSRNRILDEQKWKIDQLLRVEAILYFVFVDLSVASCKIVILKINGKSYKLK